MRHRATLHRETRGSASDRDALRTAALLFDAEIAQGDLSLHSLRDEAVLDAVRPAPIPPRVRRLAQDVERKLGRLDFESAVVRPLAALRQRVLGGRSAAPVRFLVRVDEFPHYRAGEDPAFGTEAFTRFHEVLAGAGVPYLLAVLPRVSTRPLSPGEHGSRALATDESSLLRFLSGGEVSFAVHGLDHRTRHASARRHSELSGLDAGALTGLLDRAELELAAVDLHPEVFVAPYNRFDAAQLPELAARFAVVGGGPECVRQIGFHRPPQWRGSAVYLPSYAPFYGRAAGMLDASRRVIDTRAGLWIPIVLHWEWEAQDDWRALRRLIEVIAPFTAPWEELLGAVRRSDVPA